MTFVRPLALLLLPVALGLLALSLVLLKRRAGGRGIFYASVRAVLLTLLILALAAPLLRGRVEGRAVAFVVDRSLSIPDAVVPDLGQWLAASRAHRRATDDEAVLLFADGAAVEIPFGARDHGPELDLLRPRSRLRREATDLAGAIRLATASFPEGLARRIVLVTDGNANRGDAVAEARRAASEGTEIFVLPVRYRRLREASVLRVDTVDTASPGSVVSFAPVLHSTEEDLPATLTGYVDGREVGSRTVVLPRGKWRAPPFRVLLERPGIHELSVVVRAEGDSILRNNEARAAVRVEGSAGVLVVEGGTEPGAPVREALDSMGILTAQMAASDLPDSPLLYQPFDAVVLSDVAAYELTDDQLESLEIAVRDLGIGVVVLGGEHAYAPGGYKDTALERLLPVQMEIKQKQVMLNGALVVINHTCEFPNGNYWAKQIAAASIRSLNRKDYAGIVVYGNLGDTWLLPLQQVTNPAAMAETIEASAGGDMPSFDSSLRLALSALEDCPAHMKHIIVISDGDAQQPNPRLVSQIVQAQITVSAVCVAPHGGGNGQTMKDLARWGKGRFYLVQVNQMGALPRIFIKEATTLRRQAIKRERFVPEWNTGSGDVPPALKGFGALPALEAYCLTEAKDRAEVPIVSPDSDPIFASWRYGLGETVAFTSALRGGWIGDWSGWDGLDRFLSQTVRSVFRKAGRSGFRAEGVAKGGMATVRMTALSETGNELDFLNVTGTVARPGEETREFPVLQKGGGVYEGTFPVRGDGTWVAILRYEDPETGATAQLTVPVAVSYPEEYADLDSDDGFFGRLESEAGARILTGKEDVFAGEQVSSEAAKPLAPLLLLLAALVLPIDVFFRRVRWDPLPLLRRMLPERKPRKARAPATSATAPPDTPDFEEPPDQPPDEAPPPSAPSPAVEEKDKGHIDDLLAAKKRAKKKRRWEET